MEAISGVWCYQPRGVLIIHRLNGTETTQTRIDESNHLLWCERGDRVGGGKMEIR